MKRLSFALAMLCAWPVHAQQVIQATTSVGLVLPTISPSVVCDGTTDNAPALQAAINTAEALSPSGAVIQLPACNNIGIATGLLINNSNITLQGSGGSANVAPPIAVSSFKAKPYATSVLVALAGLTGTMVTFDPAAGGAGIKGGGLNKLVLACNNVAGIGLTTNSQKGANFTDLIVENCTSNLLIVGTTSNSLQAGENTDHQHNNFRRLFLVAQSPAAINAVGMVWQGGTGTDVSFDYFEDVHIYHQNGTGFDCIKADSNIIKGITLFSPNGSTSYEIVFEANSAAPACRQTQVLYYSGVGVNATLGAVGRGQPTGSNLSQGNYIFVGTANGSFRPTIEPSGTETPVLFYAMDTGETNLASPSSENLIINGDFTIDTLLAGGSVTPASSGGFIVDRWRFLETGIASALTFQAQAATVPNRATRAMKTSVAVQTAPGAGSNFTALCQRIEGVNIRDLGWGGSDAKGITLSFWANEPVAGNYSLYIFNNGSTRFIVVNYTITNAGTWTYESISIPGDTTGIWNINIGLIGMSVCKDLGAGTTLQTGTTGVWGGTEFHEHTGDVQLVNQTAASASYWTQVRVREGRADVPYVARNFEQELELAARYRWSTFPNGTAVGQNKGVAGAICTKNPIAVGDPSIYVAFGTKMAVVPTITTYNPSATNANWRDVTASADVTVSVDPATALDTQGVLLATSGTVATLGDVLCIHLQAAGEI